MWLTLAWSPNPWLSRPQTIDPAASSVQLNSTKMDIKLKKAPAEEWPALSAEDAASQAAAHS